jgi:hypothetical protein
VRLAAIHDRLAGGAQLEVVGVRLHRIARRQRARPQAHALRHPGRTHGSLLVIRACTSHPRLHILQLGFRARDDAALAQYAARLQARPRARERMRCPAGGTDGVHSRQPVEYVKEHSHHKMLSPPGRKCHATARAAAS